MTSPACTNDADRFRTRSWPVIVLLLCAAWLGAGDGPAPEQLRLVPAPGSYPTIVPLMVTPCLGHDRRLVVTFDGSAPTAASWPLRQPCLLTDDTQVRIGVIDGQGQLAAEIAGTYQVASRLASATPVISPASGSYPGPISVSLSNSSTGTAIHYTLDGSEPTQASPRYSGSFPISSTTVVHARAFGGTNTVRIGWVTIRLPCIFPSGHRSTRYVIAAVQEEVAAPVLAPAGGTFYAPVTLQASCSTPGAVIRYRRDATAPTEADAVADPAGIPVEQTQTITVRAFLAGWIPSTAVAAQVVLQVPTPTLDPPGGAFSAPTQVIISAAAGAQARYTLDGGDPVISGLPVSGPVLVDRSQTLRVAAVRDGWEPSATVVGTYTLTVPSPTIDIAPGTYHEAFDAAITAAASDQVVRYTLDGTLPDVSSPIAAGPVRINRSTTLRARSFRDGWTGSEPASAAYVLRVLPPTLAPPPGSFTGALAVAMATPTADAAIRYTLDGTDVDAASALATAPIALPGSCSVRLRAYRDGWEASEPAQGDYVLRVPPVAPLPASGVLTAPLAISPASELGVLRYTDDGAVPTAASPILPAPFTIDRSMILTIVAFRSGWEPSEPVTGTYTWQPIIVPTVGWAETAVSVPHGSVQADLAVTFGAGSQPGQGVSWRLTVDDETIGYGPVDSPLDGGTVAVPIELPAPSPDGTARICIVTLEAPIGVTIDAASATTTITINADMPPVPRIVANPVPHAAPGTWCFDASGSSDPDGAVSSWTWRFADGTVISDIRTYHRFAALGAQVITLDVVDAFGAKATASTTIQVEELPTVTIRVQPAEISERNGVGAFLIARQGQADRELSLQLAWEGDAMPGGGIEVSGGTLSEDRASVVMPPGVVEVAIAVIAIDNSERSGARVTALRIVDGTTYRLGQIGMQVAGRAILTITDDEMPEVPADPRWYATVVTPHTSFADGTRFLIDGPTPLQHGLQTGLITPDRQAVIRGLILDHQGQPMPGVRVSVWHQPGMGWTYSRADGVYDLVVNGGDRIVVAYTRDGYLPVHRAAPVARQDWTWMSDAVMTPLALSARPIELGADRPWQAAPMYGTTDARGYRAPTILFPAGTTASIVDAAGQTRPLTTLHLRATEYTVGPRGPLAMPAELPPHIAYTYCVDITADEAITAGATTVTFDRKVAFYVTNFLDFEVGSTIPTGWYDFANARWQGEQDTVVVRLALIDGRLRLDMDRDGVADGEDEQIMGITADELLLAEDAFATQLGYDGEVVAMRTMVDHFSPLDCNALRRLRDNGYVLTGRTFERSFAVSESLQPYPTISPLQPFAWTPLTQPIATVLPPTDICDQSVQGGLSFGGVDLVISDAPGQERHVVYTIHPVEGFDAVEGAEIDLQVAGSRRHEQVQAIAGSMTRTWDGRDAYQRPHYGEIGAVASMTYLAPEVYKVIGFDLIRELQEWTNLWTKDVQYVELNHRSKFVTLPSRRGSLCPITTKNSSIRMRGERQGFIPASEWGTGDHTATLGGRSIDAGSPPSSPWTVASLFGTVGTRATMSPTTVPCSAMTFTRILDMAWAPSRGLVVLEQDESEGQVVLWIADTNFQAFHRLLSRPAWGGSISTADDYVYLVLTQAYEATRIDEIHLGTGAMRQFATDPSPGLIPVRVGGCVYALAGPGTRQLVPLDNPNVPVIPSPSGSTAGFVRFLRGAEGGLLAVLEDGSVASLSASGSEVIGTLGDIGILSSLSPYLAEGRLPLFARRTMFDDEELLISLPHNGIERIASVRYGGERTDLQIPISASRLMAGPICSLPDGSFALADDNRIVRIQKSEAASAGPELGFDTRGNLASINLPDGDTTDVVTDGSEQKLQHGKEWVSLRLGAHGISSIAGDPEHVYHGSWSFTRDDDGRVTAASSPFFTTAFTAPTFELPAIPDYGTPEYPIWPYLPGLARYASGFGLTSTVTWNDGDVWRHTMADLSRDLTLGKTVSSLGGDPEIDVTTTAAQMRSMATRQWPGITPRGLGGQMVPTSVSAEELRRSLGLPVQMRAVAGDGVPLAPGATARFPGAVRILSANGATVQAPVGMREWMSIADFAKTQIRCPVDASSQAELTVQWAGVDGGAILPVTLTTTPIMVRPRAALRASTVAVRLTARFADDDGLLPVFDPTRTDRVRFIAPDGSDITLYRLDDSATADPIPTDRIIVRSQALVIDSPAVQHIDLLCEIGPSVILADLAADIKFGTVAYDPVQPPEQQGNDGALRVPHALSICQVRVNRLTLWQLEERRASIHVVGAESVAAPPPAGMDNWLHIVLPHLSDEEARAFVAQWSITPVGEPTAYLLEDRDDAYVRVAPATVLAGHQTVRFLGGFVPQVPFETNEDANAFHAIELLGAAGTGLPASVTGFVRVLARDSEMTIIDGGEFPKLPFGLPTLFGGMARITITDDSPALPLRPTRYDDGAQTGDRDDKLRILYDADFLADDGRPGALITGWQDDATMIVSGRMPGDTVIRIVPIIDGVAQQNGGIDIAVQVDLPMLGEAGQYQTHIARLNTQLRKAAITTPDVEVKLLPTPIPPAMGGTNTTWRLPDPWHRSATEALWSPTVSTRQVDSVAETGMYLLGQLVPTTSTDTPWHRPLSGQYDPPSIFRMPAAATGVRATLELGYQDIERIWSLGAPPDNAGHWLQARLRDTGPPSEIWRRYAYMEIPGGRIVRGEEDNIRMRMLVETRIRQVMDQITLSRLRHWFSMRWDWQDPAQLPMPPHLSVAADGQTVDRIDLVGDEGNGPLAISLSRNLWQWFSDTAGWTDPLSRLLDTQITPDWAIGHPFTESILTHMIQERLSAAADVVAYIEAHGATRGMPGFPVTLPIDTDVLGELLPPFNEDEALSRLPLTIELVRRDTPGADGAIEDVVIRIPRSFIATVPHPDDGPAGLPHDCFKDSSGRLWYGLALGPTNTGDMRGYGTLGEYRVTSSGDYELSIGQWDQGDTDNLDEVDDLSIRATDPRGAMLVRLMQEVAYLRHLMDNKAALAATATLRSSAPFSFFAFSVGDFISPVGDVYRACWGREVLDGSELSGLEQSLAGSFAALEIIPGVGFVAGKALGTAKAGLRLVDRSAGRTLASTAMRNAGEIANADVARAVGDIAEDAVAQGVEAIGRRPNGFVRLANGVVDGAMRTGKFLDLDIIDVLKRHVGVASFGRLGAVKKGAGAAIASFTQILRPAGAVLTAPVWLVRNGLGQRFTARTGREAAETVDDAALLDDLMRTWRTQYGDEACAELAERFQTQACFPAGTLVEMADGSWRPIERIREGDAVRTRPEDARESPLGAYAVQRIRQWQVDGLIEVEVAASGRLAARFAGTTEHPVFVEGRGWTALADLTPGLRVWGDGWLDVQATKPIRSLTPITVYSLAIEAAHTYRVAATSTNPTNMAVWVHNECAIMSMMMELVRHEMRLRGRDSIFPREAARRLAHQRLNALHHELVRISARWRWKGLPFHVDPNTGIPTHPSAMPDFARSANPIGKGDSANLGDNMGSLIPRPPHHAAHHIIPTGIAEKYKAFLADIGFDLDNPKNGTWLPTFVVKNAGELKPGSAAYHAGNHPGFSRAMDSVLKDVKDTYHDKILASVPGSPEYGRLIKEVQTKVERIQTEARNLLQSDGRAHNLVLRPGQDTEALKEVWETRLRSVMHLP